MRPAPRHFAIPVKSGGSKAGYVHRVRFSMYMYVILCFMEVPITQFRRDLFSLMNKALEGSEVWVTHKGRRLKIVPEGKPVSRLSRITPLDIIASGVDLEEDSWKLEMMREWERKWDRRLAPLAKPAVKASPAAKARKARRA
jgi:hypothetical protein